MNWDTEFLFIALHEITKTIVKRTTSAIQKEIDKVGDRIEKSICKEDNIIEYDQRSSIKRYIIYSMGGINNIAFWKTYQNGYMFVFFDFSKVHYKNFKNLGARVWISEERGSIILRPREYEIYIEMNDFLDSLH